MQRFDLRNKIYQKSVTEVSLHGRLPSCQVNSVHRAAVAEYDALLWKMDNRKPVSISNVPSFYPVNDFRDLIGKFETG